MRGFEIFAWIVLIILLSREPAVLPAAPLLVRVRPDHSGIAKALPADSIGPAAVFIEHVKVPHIIRSALPRQIAIANYVNPF